MSVDLSVSIPQAVSTVATDDLAECVYRLSYGFNTASGKHCCNLIEIYIPPEVTSFNTASGKHCCNLLK